MNKDEIKVICDLRGDDAQAFIDKIHKVGFVFFSSFMEHSLITFVLFAHSLFELSTSTVRPWSSLISHRAFGRNV